MRTASSGSQLTEPSPKPSRRPSARYSAPRTTAGLTDTAATTSAVQHGFRIVLAVVWLAIAWWTLALGFEYYGTPLQERAFSELRGVFGASGDLGQLYGVIGSSMMGFGVAMYSLRKRMKLLAKVGKLTYWLDFHIFLCTLGPYLVVLHTAFKIGGIVSIAFWSMVVVVASGVLGRYLYGHIPKAINGQFLTLDAIAERKDGFKTHLVEERGFDLDDVRRVLDVGEPPVARGFVHALFIALRFDVAKRFRGMKLNRMLKRKNAPRKLRIKAVKLLQEHFALEQSIALLTPFQRLFGLWHVLHLPLAIVMFVIMAIHIGVAITFGYAWAA